MRGGTGLDLDLGPGAVPRPALCPALRTALRTGLLWALVGCCAGSKELSAVDVNAVVCPGGGGQAEVEVVLDGGSSLSEPHVLTLWRTSPEPVTVTFQLHAITSTGSLGQPVIDRTTVTLQKVGSRRLDSKPGPPWPRLPDTPVSGPSAGAQICQEFFLLDGRAPVELPDSWAEARQAFRDMCDVELGSREDCAKHEEDIFDGYPRSDAAVEDPVADDAALCQRLLHFSRRMVVPEGGAAGGGDAENVSSIVWAPPRRMKGSTSSGSPAVAGHTSSSRVAGTTGTYGYSTTRIASSYPRGYTATSYGYAGYGAPQARAHAAGFYYVRFWYFPSFGHSRGYTRCADSAETCSPEDGGCRGDQCTWHITEDFARDDLMNTGFTPSDYEDATKYKLTIYTVKGTHYAQSRICPPSNWDPSAGSTSWTPPDKQDLFVSLTQMEHVTEDEDLGGFIAAAIAMSLIILCFCVCCCCFLNKNKGQSQEWSQEFMEMQAHREAAEGDNFAGHILAVLELSTWENQDIDIEYVPAVHKWEVAPDGTLTGVVYRGAQTFVVVGVVRSPEACGMVWWKESAQDGSGVEVEAVGSIRRDGDVYRVTGTSMFSVDGKPPGPKSLVQLQTACVQANPVVEGTIVQGTVVQGTVYGAPSLPGAAHTEPMGEALPNMAAPSCAGGLTNRASGSGMPAGLPNRAHSYSPSQE